MAQTLTPGKEQSLFTLYSTVSAVKVNWLWYPYLAEGKITLLQGDPGDGKSTMMLHLIGEISRGGKSPDGIPFGAPGRVVYQCSEDGIADTIKPRLEACQTNCENVAFINEEVHNGLTLDDERLLKTIVQFRPRLLVVDPIQACGSLYELMGWSIDFRYRFRGVSRQRGDSKIVLFQLEEPVLLPNTRDQEISAPSAMEWREQQNERFERMTRGISENDISAPGSVITNPLIGEIPSRDELEDQLEKLLMSM